MINAFKQCQRELQDFPLAVREDLADALARLDQGQKLSMPLSRPMPTIGAGVHELRFRDRSGVYRVIYVLLGAETVWLLHAFMKKSSQTPPHNIELARKRLKEVR